VEPHPTPHAFFAFGSNAPNPLAGDGVILGICNGIKDLNRLFGFHRGIGEKVPSREGSEEEGATSGEGGKGGREGKEP
jgi:hypothetical protein